MISPIKNYPLNRVNISPGLGGLATESWDMFETHYFDTVPRNAPGCPLVPPIHSANEEWQTASGSWEDIDTIPSAYNYRVYDAADQCLDSDDQSGTGYYYLMTAVSLHEWYVYSRYSAPGGCTENCEQQYPYDGGGNSTGGPYPYIYSYCGGFVNCPMVKPVKPPI